MYLSENRILLTIMDIKLNSKKVVIVEDDQFLGGLISNKIKDSGADIVLINTGDGALEKIIESKPDVIILDLLLPNINGFEILKSLRSTKGFEKTPVIVLSNLSEGSDIQKAKDLGITEFLIKATVNINEIPTHIAKAIK